MTVLRWTAHHQPMAFATHDFGWGKVDILYNDQPAGNLHIITARIQNDSQKDLQDLEFQCLFNEGTSVLRSIAQIVGTLDALPFGPAYAKVLTEASHRQLTAAEIAAWSPRSDFIAPVLNRGAAIDVAFLLSRGDHSAPVLTLHSNHLGVRLRQQKPAVQFLGVNQQHAAFVGLFVGFAVAITVVKTGYASWPGALLPWLVGALGLLVGAAVIWAWRWISRLAS